MPNSSTPTNANVAAHSGEVSRRAVLKYSAGTIAAISMGSLTFGCGAGTSTGAPLQPYPIDPARVGTTQQRMIAFPATPPGALAAPLQPKNLNQVASYNSLGYGSWTFGSGLPLSKRYDLMPGVPLSPASVRKTKLVNFFAFTDIHITDKEAPNQIIYLQQFDPNSANNTSIYSPVMMCTTQVLDAAIQTANALHKQSPFDFGISLGDTCNNTSYNELRWYLDVIDGKPITPSSGAHAGAGTIDYQKPYQAVGLDKSIPWYQALGNHDHFYIGSFPVDADPSLGIRQSYLADTIWAVADALNPALNIANFPVMFDMENLKGPPTYYMGTFNGASPYGETLYTGLSSDTRFSAGAPKVAADPDRRSLLRSEWVQEFFNTTSSPVGHGFNLVDKTDPNWNPNGFACYSFLPNVKMPLKIIVLDNTQSEHDGSTDIHGHGYLDAARWAWLRAELAAGQAQNQLMIIAAHVPIGVSAIASETEWWAQTTNITPEHQNAVNLKDLVATCQATPNLLMWIAGHRHLNAVKAFKSLDVAKPEQGFWQVETSSLRDFPQQFRTFQVYLNSDYTVSIVTTNVDPAVADGTPAAASRTYAVAAQQIVKNNVTLSNPNVASVFNGFDKSNQAMLVPVPTIDPTQQQVGWVLPVVAGGAVPSGSLMAGATPDPTILFEDMSDASRYPLPVPVNGSCNAELFKALSPQMITVLKALFPQPA